NTRYRHSFPTRRSSDLAETHTVVLPHAASYNAEAASEAMARIARALGANSAAAGLYDLASDIGAPLSLASLGIKLEDLDRAADRSEEHTSELQSHLNLV